MKAWWNKPLSKAPRNDDARAGGGDSRAAEETAVEIGHWTAGEANPTTTGIVRDRFTRLIQFGCPTCGRDVQCPSDRVEDDVGVMVECPHCDNISHVPAFDSKGSVQDSEIQIYCCVVVPTDEFPAWYFAHPVVEDADPAMEASYGLWAWCASCKHQYRSSVLFSFALTDSVGSMVMNANSAESARDFNALVDGHCPECSHGELLALRLPIPPRLKELLGQLEGAAT